MRLEELTGDLASAVASAQPTAGGDVAIGGLAYDSRAVRPEDLFFCVSGFQSDGRSEEHTSELQSQSNLVCRLLLEKKKQKSFQPLNSTLVARATPHDGLS